MGRLILVEILMIVLSSTLELSQPQLSCADRDTNYTKCACEVHESFSISCTNNQIILILSAFYGRLENETCNDGKGNNYQNWSLSCRYHNATEVLSQNCNNQSTYSIGEKEYNNIFEDPCPDTGKYLRVNYTCISAYQSSTFSIDQTTMKSIHQTKTNPVDQTTMKWTHQIRTNPVDQSTAKPTEGSCTCRPEVRRNVSWPTTDCGRNQTQNCPNNPKRRRAKRWCSKDGSWDNPNLVKCITEEIERMGQELKSLEANFTVSAANDMMTGVENISLSNDLYGGDLYELTKVMVVLIQLSQNNSGRFTASDADYLSALALNSTSNLLSDAYNETWNELLPYHQSQTATRLLEGMEQSSAILAAATKNQTSIRKSAPGIEALQINVTATKSQQTSITFSVSDLDSAEISSEDLEERASNDKLGRVAFILYNDIAKRLTSNASIEENPEAVANATEPDNGTYFKPFIITKVVSASIISDKEPSRKELIKPIRFTLKHNSPKLNASELKCVFWKYWKGDFVGHWSDEGCRIVSSNEYYTTCECDHLTNFAVLMSTANKKISAEHLFALHVITNIGCAISIVCLALALFTFCFFRNLQSDRNTIHKNLVLSLLIAELVFVFGITQNGNQTLCAVIAGFLHYFFLASFAWMCLEGVQLYVLLVEVFEIEKSRVKWYYLGGYGIPALIVLISACVNAKLTTTEYPHGGYGKKEYCWLNKDTNNFVWAFNGPVFAVLTVNLVMLGLAIYMMCKHASAASWKLKEKSKIYKIGSWLRGAAILVVLLGTTWTFGIFLLFESQEVAYDYIFAILNSFQGLFIFVFHCLTNDKVKKEYQRAIGQSSWIPECVRVKYGDYNGNGALATPNQSTTSGKTLLQKVFPKNKRKQSVSSSSSQQMLDSPSPNSRRGFKVIISSPQEKEWPRLINTVSESVQLTDSSGFASNDSDGGRSTELSSEYSEPYNARINDSQFNA